jgi:hypothetical protein
MPFFVGRKQIQSMVEGETQSILNIQIENILKTIYSKYTNQYITYSEQVKAIYDGYQSKKAYGSAMIADIIDKRVNLIVSEGLSITAKKNQTQNFINFFIEENKLDGSNLIELVNISEMEGRVLTHIFPFVKKDNSKTVKTKNYRHYLKKYTVKAINDEPDAIEMKEEGKDKPTIFRKEEFVYTHNGIALDYDPNPCAASVLTECEFCDRTLYDLRFNNHLFGVTTPNIKTNDAQLADKVRNDIDDTKWKPGKTIIGPEISFPQPPNAGDNVAKELSLYLKKISSRTGIPVHWLGWTDLMSNRATSYDLRDFITMSIRDEKIRSREFIRDLILKSMIMAVEYGVEGAIYDEDFTVDIPDVSMETVKMLNETWLPLYDAKLISKFDIQNKIPGINPMKTNKEIEKDENDNMEEYSNGIRKPEHDKKNEDINKKQEDVA